jgi:SAM-dependent methyltransferase
LNPDATGAGKPPELIDRNDPKPGDARDQTCPLCAHGRAEVLPFRYAFGARFLYGVRCSGCSFTYLDPMPSDDEIRALYEEDYFTTCSETCGAHGPRAYMEMAAESGEDRRHSAKRLERLLLQHRGSRGDLLEVGCGPGYFLAELKALGWRVLGLEVSEFAAKVGREKLGIEIRIGHLERRTFEPDSFDVVFMGDVLEHLPRPRESLEAIRSWLRPGGIVAIAVPATMNLLAARLGLFTYAKARRFKTMRIPPYHLCEYTPRTLKHMIEQSGFRIRLLRQSAVPLGRMGLRGSTLENAGKVVLQVCAHLTSRLVNRGGDRLLAIAERR